MDSKQSRAMRWILFSVFTFIFFAVTVCTMLAVFAGVGNLQPAERATAFNVFLAEVGIAVVALFYSLFGLKHATAIVKEPHPETSKQNSSLKASGAAQTEAEKFGIVKAFEVRSISIKPEYDQRLAAARKHIDIMAYGLNALRQDFGADFATWATRANVRILLLDPEFPNTKNSLASLRDQEEGEPVGTIQRNVREFVRTTAPLCRSSAGRFEVRLYRCLPTVNIFRIDDEAFWGPYFIKIPSRSTPTFIVKKGILYEKLVSHFEAVWTDDKLSRPVPEEWLNG